MARPRPAPPLERVRDGSERQNRSNTRFASSVAMPGPSSATSIIASSRLGDDAHVHGSVGRRVAVRVLQQVPEHLADAGLVAGHEDRAVRREVDRAVGRDRARVVDRVARQAREVDGLAFERPALVEARQQQHVVDERAHAIGFFFDAPHRLGEVFRAIGRAASEQLGVAADRSERSAQLVRRVADETSQPTFGRGASRRTRFRSVASSRSARARAFRPRCARRRCRCAATDRRPRLRPPSPACARAAAARA